jgi:hypothetical protein
LASLPRSKMVGIIVYDFSFVYWWLCHSEGTSVASYCWLWMILTRCCRISLNTDISLRFIADIPRKVVFCLAGSNCKSLIGSIYLYRAADSEWFRLNNTRLILILTFHRDFYALVISNY